MAGEHWPTLTDMEHTEGTHRGVKRSAGMSNNDPADALRQVGKAGSSSSRGAAQLGSSRHSPVHVVCNVAHVRAGLMGFSLHPPSCDVQISRHAARAAGLAQVLELAQQAGDSGEYDTIAQRALEAGHSLPWPESGLLLRLDHLAGLADDCGAAELEALQAVPKLKFLKFWLPVRAGPVAGGLPTWSGLQPGPLQHAGTAVQQRVCMLRCRRSSCS